MIKILIVNNINGKKIDNVLVIKKENKINNTNKILIINK
jgi:hypothetical protein